MSVCLLIREENGTQMQSDVIADMLIAGTVVVGHGVDKVRAFRRCQYYRCPEASGVGLLT